MQRGRVDVPESARPCSYPVDAKLETYVRMTSRSREPSLRSIVSMPEPAEPDDARDVWDVLGDFA